MPRISEFFGIVIYMYYQDNRVHHTPHFHAEYAGEEVVVSIPDAEVLAGSIPPKKEKLVKAWAVLRERELQQAWAAAVEDTVVDLAPRVTEVEPLTGYALRVTFATGEVRRVDCRPFLDKGVFQRLKDEDEFRRVQPINNGGGIGWASGADLSRDTVYVTGEPV